MTVRAIWVDKNEAGYRAELRDDVDVSTFPVDGDAVDVDVEWSTLNYKDALGDHRQGQGAALVPARARASTSPAR